MKKLFAIFVCLSVILTMFASLTVNVFAVEASGVTVYASADAKADGDGSLKKPFTLQKAKDYLKGLSKTNGTSKGATVYLLGGTYVFDSVLEFDSTDMPDVTYKAYNNQEVVFSGAKEIKGFSQYQVNGVNVFRKQFDTSKTDWHYKTIFSDTNTLSVTRYPETGYFTVKATAPEDDIFTPETTEWEYTLGQKSFYYDKKELTPDFKNIEDVNVRILHYWHDELMHITAVDTEKGKISLSRPSSMMIRDIDRFYFENVMEALNKPGEYYLDKADGYLYYVPFKGEKVNDLVLYGSTLDRLITINGVDGISFEGVRFTRTDWVYPEADGLYEDSFWDKNDMDFPQAAICVDGVITVKYAENVHFKNCEFTHLGGSAIKMMDGVRNSSVENCYFEQIDASAIYVGGQNCYPGDEAYTSNILIKNNEIYKYGRKFFCAIGIHVTYCDTAEIVNNEIHDGYYTGISVGWTWGYDYNVTKNINISRNLIYNIGQGWLSDMGGIYTLGKQPGTVISENVIHNVAADSGEGGYGGWGIYLDEGSSFMTVEKNLVYCCGSQSLNIHYGEGNVIRNNIAAFSGGGLVNPGIDKGETHATATYYNNIFLTKDKAPIYVNMLNTSHFYDNGNLFWSLTEGEDVYFDVSETGGRAYTLKDAQKNDFIHYSTVADPLFKDAAKFDFTLNENSPAFALNFEAWDYSVAGTIKDTVIGLDKKGGTTQYNDNADFVEMKDYKPSTFYHRLPLIVVGIALALVLFWLIILIVKTDKKTTIPFVSVLLTLPCFVVSYINYIDWNELPYYLAAFGIGLFSTSIPVSSMIIKKKSKKKVIGLGILAFVLSTGLFLGLAGILNMLLGSDNPYVILSTISAMIVYMFVTTIIYCKKAKE